MVMMISEEAPSAPVFLPRGLPSFVLSADLGQSVDPTAICILQLQRGVLDDNSEFNRHCGVSVTPQRPCELIDVRYLERLPLGTNYVRVVEHVRGLLSRPPLGSDTTFCIDETGVGKAVGDIFVDAGLTPKRITITSGHDVTPAGEDRWHVPKLLLISNLDSMLHRGVLRIAPALTDAGTLKDELKDFRRKVSDAGRMSYAARVGKHDDLVLSIALGCWWFRRKETVPEAAYGRWGM